MTPKELGKYVNNLIANAEIEQAFKQMLQFFNGKPGFRSLRSQVLYIQSQYFKTKKDEEKGLISFDNAKLSYNQITSQLIGIAGRLESGEFNPGQEEKQQKVRWALLVGLPLIVAAAWGAFALLGPGEPTEPVGSGFTCPSFIPADYRILVLPFQPIGIKKTVTETHQRIKDRIEEISAKNRINTSCGTIKETDFAFDNERYPNTPNDAQVIGGECNSDLIIWGTTEEIEDQITVRRKFKFLNLEEGFALTKIKQVEGDTVEVLNTFTSIATGEALTGEIEEILLGIVAFNTGQTDKAIALLSDAKAEEPSAILWKETFLANAYIKDGKTAKAIESYNHLLEVEPKNDLALNNRAMLNYQSGNYIEAVEDFSQHLDLKPNVSNALVARGVAYYKSNMLNKAEADLKKAVELDERNPKAVQKYNEVKNIIEKTKKIMESAESKKVRQPSNKEALLESAEANF